LEELVSVIIPFHNVEEYIGGAIESILSQTYSNIEVILVDDNSTDRSVEICHSYTDPRISLYHKAPLPRGTTLTRNMGIDHAKGSIIAFHDGDDISLPTRIEKQVALIKKHGPNTICGVWVEKIIGGVPKKMVLPADHEEIVKAFTRIYRRERSIVAGVLCAKAQIFREFRYNPLMGDMEDWDFLLRLHESGQFRFYNVPEYLYRYMIHPAGTKYDKNWVNWNMVVRNNQERRKNKQPEFANPAEMFRYLRSHPVRLIKSTIIKWLILLKIRISFEYRRTFSK
jgi:glycosyltransferase involved in cell wall biosynthesis